MPGVGIPGFVRRSIDIALAGVYNLRIHHDNVVAPLLQWWNIANLRDLTPTAAQLQEMVMSLPAMILAKAERFEARYGLAGA
jgi:acyl-[acyl-carrier-protein] desaturase